jgi:hypothetical protein
MMTCVIILFLPRSKNKWGVGRVVVLKGRRLFPQAILSGEQEWELVQNAEGE